MFIIIYQTGKNRHIYLAKLEFVSIVSSIIHYNKTVAEKVTKVRDVKKLYYFSHSFVRLLSYSKL
jgi:hypothetical protein